MDGFIGRFEHCTNAYADAHCKYGLSITLPHTPLYQLTARSQFMAGASCVLRVSCGWVHRAF